MKLEARAPCAMIESPQLARPGDAMDGLPSDSVIFGHTRPLPTYLSIPSWPAWGQNRARREIVVSDGHGPWENR